VKAGWMALFLFQVDLGLKYFFFLFFLGVKEVFIFFKVLKTDRVGFEPTIRLKRMPVFKTGAFSRSAIYPG